MKYRYRIRNSDGTYHNAGTDKPSWFSLNDAKKIVDYKKNQQVRECDGVYDLWEVL